jgi:hypothetical protein
MFQESEPRSSLLGSLAEKLASWTTRAVKSTAKRARQELTSSVRRPA